MKISQHLETGDILHCQGNSLISRLIRRFTKSRISHTALVLRIEGTLFIADSQRDGTHLRPFNDWQRKYKYKFWVHRLRHSNRVNRRGIVKAKALDVIGTKKYDFASLLWYHPRYILTGRWKGKKTDSADERFYCSEFVAYCWDFPKWWRLSPEDLKEFLNNQPGFIRYYPMGNIF